MTDIATRVHDHNWRIDPIVRSLLDTDFYKLLMLQTVYRRHPDVTVEFSLINRSKDVPLARLIDEDDLRAQLDHIRGLRLSRGESTWLRGNTFYGKRWMFGPDFMAWLEDFRMPEYRLERRGDQYELTFARLLARGDDVGDPGARGADGAALARRAARHGQVRAAGALRPGDDPALGEDRAAAQAAGPPDLGLRHPAAALVSSGRTGRCRR